MRKLADNFPQPGTISCFNIGTEVEVLVEFRDDFADFLNS